jgi:hypothetical protein
MRYTAEKILLTFFESRVVNSSTTTTNNNNNTSTFLVLTSGKFLAFLLGWMLQVALSLSTRHVPGFVLTNKRDCTRSKCLHLRMVTYFKKLVHESGIDYMRSTNNQSNC